MHPQGNSISDQTDLSSTIEDNQGHIDTPLLQYAKELRDTENYPMAQFVSGGKNGKDLKQRNEKAKKEFTERFMEIFSDTHLVLDQHPDFELVFDTITFDTNYNSYTLHFKKEKNTTERFYFTSSGGNIYQLPPKTLDIVEGLSPKSQEKLRDMLAYHSDSKNFKGRLLTQHMTQKELTENLMHE